MTHTVLSDHTAYFSKYFIIEATVVSVERTSNNLGLSPIIYLITNPPIPKGTILIKSIDNIDSN